MGTTPIELFRSGNSRSARLDSVRINGVNPDVDVRTDHVGAVWVVANGKGVSTWDTPDLAWGKTWRLPVGSAYSNTLLVWNDDPGHWVWEPVHDMLLSDYQAALANANVKFLRV